MLKGGYQIINLDGVNFKNSTPINVKGIHDTIEGTRKQIMLSGITYTDIEQRDMFVNFKNSSGTFTGNITLYSGEATITIGSDDNVTITIKKA